jgi:hypothetical protein
MLKGLRLHWSSSHSFSPIIFAGTPFAPIFNLTLLVLDTQMPIVYVISHQHGDIEQRVRVGQTKIVVGWIDGNAPCV